MTRLQVELVKEHRKVSKLLTKLYGVLEYVKVERNTRGDYSSILVLMSSTHDTCELWYISQNLTTKQLLQYIKHNTPV
jgi:hypothetical protein